MCVLVWGSATVHCFGHVEICLAGQEILGLWKQVTLLCPQNVAIYVSVCTVASHFSRAAFP